MHNAAIVSTRIVSAPLGSMSAVINREPERQPEHDSSFEASASRTPLSVISVVAQVATEARSARGRRTPAAQPDDRIREQNAQPFRDRLCAVRNQLLPI